MPGPIARGQISFVDLNDGKTLNFLLTSNRPNTQIYTPDGSVYAPDYSSAAGRLYVFPELYVSGENGNQAGSLTQVVWKINGQTPAQASDYPDSVVYYNADGHRLILDGVTYNNALEIANNISENTLVVDCSAVYTDPSNGLQTPVKASITFTKVVNAGSSIIAVLNAPDGNVFRNKDVQSLRLICSMWRGSSIDESDVEYTWFRRDAEGTDNDWVQITDANAGGIVPGFMSMKTPATPTPQTVSFALKNCNMITIPESAVTNYDIFKCVCKDKDTSYPTYNTDVCDYITVLDYTDPWQIEFQAPAGTTLNAGMVSSTVECILWQNGKRYDPVDDASFYATLTFTWTKYSKTGVQDTSWGTSGHKTGRSLTVTRAEIDVAATFAVEVTLTV